MVQVVGDGCTYLWTVLQGVDHGLAEPYGSIAGRRQSGPRQRRLNAVPVVIYVRVEGMRWGGGRGSVAHDMFLFLFLFLFCFFFLILRIQVQEPVRLFLIAYNSSPNATDIACNYIGLITKSYNAFCSVCNAVAYRYRSSLYYKQYSILMPIRISRFFYPSRCPYAIMLYLLR